jgi:hypothetical protein
MTTISLLGEVTWSGEAQDDLIDTLKGKNHITINVGGDLVTLIGLPRQMLSDIPHNFMYKPATIEVTL